MHIKELLTPERALCCHDLLSRKRALEFISELLCQEFVDTDYLELFEAFIARENLGSTALGHGVAIPHIRSSATQHALAVLLQLETPIEFDAPDQQPVDVIIALIVPEHDNEQHLHILAHLAKLFSAESFRQQLRTANDDLELYNSAVHYDQH